MAASAGSDPVTDDEIVYRRVSEESGWYDTSSDRPVAWEAFRPNRNDVDGVSVWRAKYRSALETATVAAKPGRRYFVLGLRVGELRMAGVRVEPSPHEGGAGHASLVNLNAAAYSRDKNSIRGLAEQIARGPIEKVDGPFGPFGPLEA